MPTDVIVDVLDSLTKSSCQPIGYTYLPAACFWFAW